MTAQMIKQSPHDFPVRNHFPSQRPTPLAINTIITCRLPPLPNRHPFCHHCTASSQLSLDLGQVLMQLGLALDHPLYNLLDHVCLVLGDGGVELFELLFRGAINGGLGARGLRGVLCGEGWLG
jgi:hypothetical protein